MRDTLQGEYSVLSDIVDIYFHNYHLEIKVDEFGHDDRNSNYEKQRQKAIRKELGCKLIRINSDEENLNERKAINEIYRHL